MTLKQEMESSPHGNLCAALCTATKTTTNISKATDDDCGGKEHLFLFSLALTDFWQHQPSNFKGVSATPARFGLVLIFPGHMITLVRSITFQGLSGKVVTVLHNL